MNKFKVLVTSKHPGNAARSLAERFEVDLNSDNAVLGPGELAARLRGCDAVLTLLEDRMTAGLMASLPHLKVVANCAVGYDNVDVQAATRLGILVTNTPGVLDETTADLAFALLLACARRVVEADRFVREGRWRSFTPDLLLGVDVHGKTLGIVGMGRIGKAMARRAHGFGMSILYTRRSAAPADGAPPGARAVSLEKLLAVSDFVSVHCPLDSQTRHLIGRRGFSIIKEGSILVNTARGAVVDQAALIEALDRGRLRGAGLDVFEAEPAVPPQLIASGRVVLTPHIGSASIETRSAMAQLAADSILSALSGRMPANAVNPEVWETMAARLRSGAAQA